MTCQLRSSILALQKNRNHQSKIWRVSQPEEQKATKLPRRGNAITVIWRTKLIHHDQMCSHWLQSFSPLSRVAHRFGKLSQVINCTNTSWATTSTALSNSGVSTQPLGNWGKWTHELNSLTSWTKCWGQIALIDWLWKRWQSIHGCSCLLTMQLLKQRCFQSWITGHNF